MADNSSVTSGIQFESFKMDKIDFSVTPELGVLASVNHSDCDISFSIGFRNAFKYNIENKVTYVTGLKIDVKIENKEKKELAKGTFIINGLFTSIGTLEKSVEEKIIKYQCPTILFPYIRASISFTLSSAGFSTLVMPLVNVNSAAKEANIEIIEQ